MRYLLVVGFSCSVYKQEPRARIHVNDQLIDEFHISHTSKNCIIEENKFYKITPLEPFSREEILNIKIKNFPDLKFYEVEIDEKVKHVSLRININNNDNNYSNGFITHSTLIKLKVCYFFPFNKRLLLRLKEIRDKYLFSKNYSWYRNSRNFIFDLVANGMCWKGTNGEFIDKKKSYLSQNDTGNISIGGDGEYSAILKKKYRVLMPKLARAYRYQLDWKLLNYFFDKYFQYANQRNSS